MYNQDVTASTSIGLEVGGDVESPEVFGNQFNVATKVATRRWLGKPGSHFSAE